MGPLKGLALMGQRAAETCIFEGVSTDRFSCTSKAL